MSAPLRALAGPFARTALRNIATPFPQRVDGVQTRPGAVPEPRAEHPVFYGAYDWHSCVHMHWLLVRLLRLFPGANWEQEAIEGLASRLRPDGLFKERDYFVQPANQSFERPYGWAWVFKLDVELRKLSPQLPLAQSWLTALAPLSQTLRENYLDYLSRLAFPIRAGTHSNTAFSMLLALDLADCSEDLELAHDVKESALRWFGHDRAYPAAYEPDGEDFLSGGLLEAVLMSRSLPASEFQDWWGSFEPDSVGWRAWSTPIQRIDRQDARLVHLEGLNLSRAWCLRLLARALPVRRAELDEACQRHLTVSLPHATGGDYVGEHWLASFATLALSS